jgi:MFS family permease
MSRPLLAQGAFYTAGVQLSNVSVVLPFICAQSGFGWVAGLLFPIFSVGTIIGNSTSPVILHWSRRVKHLVVAAAASVMALLVAFNAMTATTDHSSAASLLVTTGAIGVMAGISSVAFADVVCTTLPDGQRGRLLLNQGAAGSVLATVTTVVIAPLVFHDCSPAGHVHVLWLGAAALAIAAVIALFLRPNGSTSPAPAPAGSPLDTYRVGLRIVRTQPWFRRYAITHLMFVPILLGSTFHTLRASDGDVGLPALVVTSSIGLVTGSVLWRTVARTFGVRGMLLGSAALSSTAAVGSTAAEIFGVTANTWLQIAIILLATMAAQAVFTAAITWIGAFADEHRATLIAFAAMMVAVTSTAVGGALGVIAQIQIPGWPVAVMLALNVASGAMALRAPGPSVRAPERSTPAPVCRRPSPSRAFAY